MVLELEVRARCTKAGGNPLIVTRGLGFDVGEDGHAGYLTNAHGAWGAVSALAAIEQINRYIIGRRWG